MKQSYSGSCAKPNTSDGLQFTQQRASEHLWTLSANFWFWGGFILPCGPLVEEIEISPLCKADAEMWGLRYHAPQQLLLSHVGWDSCGFKEKMEIKWDILLLLLCLSHTICRWQYSAAIYQRDPLILTDLIKETHWQPFYLRGSTVVIKELLLTHIFIGCYCKDWLSEQLEVTGFVALLHQQSILLDTLQFW